MHLALTNKIKIENIQTSLQQIRCIKTIQFVAISITVSVDWDIINTCTTKMLTCYSYVSFKLSHDLLNFPCAFAAAFLGSCMDWKNVTICMFYSLYRCTKILSVPYNNENKWMLPGGVEPRCLRIVAPTPVKLLLRIF